MHMRQYLEVRAESGLKKWPRNVDIGLEMFTLDTKIGHENMLSWPIFVFNLFVSNFSVTNFFLVQCQHFEANFRGQIQLLPLGPTLHMCIESIQISQCLLVYTLLL